MPPRRAWSEPDEQVLDGNGVPKGIRTPVTAVKGRCPRPLDDGDLLKVQRKLLNINSSLKAVNSLFVKLRTFSPRRNHTP